MQQIHFGNALSRYEFNNNIPKQYRPLLQPFTTASCMLSHAMDIIEQHIQVNGCCIGYETIIAREPVNIQYELSKQKYIIQCMLAGNLRYALPGDQSLYVHQGQYHFLQCEPGNYHLPLQPCTYTSFYIDLPVFLLQKIAARAPVIQQLLNAGNKHAATQTLGNNILTSELLQEIMEILQSDRKRPLFDIKLEGRLLYLLSRMIELVEQSDGEDAPNLMTTIKNYIDTHLEEPLSLKKISRAYYVSEASLKQRFKVFTGENFSDYTIKKRMEKARELLQSSELTIGDIAHRVGYEEPTNFTREYKKYFNRVPSSERKICYGLTNSSEMIS